MQYLKGKGNETSGRHNQALKDNQEKVASIGKEFKKEGKSPLVIQNISKN